MKELTSENLYKIAKKEKLPYFIKFSSSSCAPCQAMKPVFKAFEVENPSISVYEVDINKHPDLAGHFGIRSVPTTLVCEKREILYTFNGTTPKGDLQFVIDNINDPHFREHGAFNVDKKSTNSFYWLVGGTVLFLLALFLVLPMIS